MRALLIQSIRQVIAHDADSDWTEQVMIGTIGGGALPTDPNPNTTPPAANRIFRCANRSRALFANTTSTSTGCGARVATSVAGGSSMTVQLWFYDDTQARWVEYDFPRTFTPNGVNPNINLALWNNVGAHFIGAKFFVQITANTGVEVLAASWT